MSTLDSTKQLKVGLVFLGRKRPGFDMEWGAAMERAMRAAVGASEFDVFEPPERAVDEPSLRQVIAQCEAADVDALVLLQCTMSDGRLCATLAQLWPHPPILWATPEKQEGDIVSSCSLVGLHAWGATLRQMQHPFELVYGDPGAAETWAQFGRAVRLVAAAKHLRRLRVAIVGGQAPGFFTMAADPFTPYNLLGAQVHYFSLVEFGDTVQGFSDEAVAQDVAKVKALGFAHKDMTDEDLPMASRLYLAMRHYMDTENIGALSVRCWPEMPNVFGQWPYLGMARLAEEGRAIACEGDADGALCAWIAERLGMGPCYLTDWLEHDRETITVWHGGAAPFSLSPSVGQPGAPRFARHFNNKKPGVVDATLKADLPVTLFRLWRCDGEYLLTAGEGVTLPTRRPLMGTNGLVRMSSQNPMVWFEELVHAGMPHHVTVVPGHHRDTLRRLGRLLRVRWSD